MCEVLGLQYQILMNFNIKLSHKGHECECVYKFKELNTDLYSINVCRLQKKQMYAQESNLISRVITRCFVSFI